MVTSRDTLFLFSLTHLAFYTQCTWLHKANSFHAAALNTLTNKSSFLHSFFPTFRAWVRIDFESSAPSLDQDLRVTIHRKICDASFRFFFLDHSAICVFSKLWGCCDRGLLFLVRFLCRNVGQWTVFSILSEIRRELEVPIRWVLLRFLMKISDALNKLYYYVVTLKHVSPASQSEHD